MTSDDCKTSHDNAMSTVTSCNSTTYPHNHIPQCLQSYVPLSQAPQECRFVKDMPRDNGDGLCHRGRDGQLLRGEMRLDWEANLEINVTFKHEVNTKVCIAHEMSTHS